MGSSSASCLVIIKVSQGCPVCDDSGKSLGEIGDRIQNNRICMRLIFPRHGKIREIIYKTLKYGNGVVTAPECSDCLGGRAYLETTVTKFPAAIVITETYCIENPLSIGFVVNFPTMCHCYPRSDAPASKIMQQPWISKGFHFLDLDGRGCRGRVARCSDRNSDASRSFETF